MSDEIGKLIAESLARNQQHAAHVEGAEMWEWLATFLLRDLRAEGYTIAALPKNLSCEQKDVIKRAIQSARINGRRARIEGEYLDIIGCRILDDLHAAGYEIEPGWSANLDAAPRDGTPIFIYVQFPLQQGSMSPEVIRTYWSDPKLRGFHGNCYRGWSGQLHSGYASLWEIESCGGVPTHWRPDPTPPKESE